MAMATPDSIADLNKPEKLILPPHWRTAPFNPSW